MTPNWKVVKNDTNFLFLLPVGTSLCRWGLINRYLFWRVFV